MVQLGASNVRDSADGFRYKLVSGLERREVTEK